jgi:cytochrome c oxidase assembly protein subunit 15
MIAVIGLSVISGATLGHLGMPAFVQPTHLLAATLLFGLQFLIWMSYRHSRDSVLHMASEAPRRVVHSEQIATAT